MYSDIESFKNQQLLDVAARRVRATEARQCWYCGLNIRAHTCKHAEVPRFHGWTVEAPERFTDPDGMRGWITTATRIGDDRVATGTGLTRDVADQQCFAQIEGTPAPC